MEYMNVYNQKYIEVVSRTEIFPMYRVELLDHYENVLADMTDNIASDNTGSISINYQQGVRRTCTITLFDNDGKFIPRVDGDIWINKKFKLYIGIKDIFTDDIYWFSQGVYCLIDPVVDRENKTITLNGVDKYGFLGSETGFNQITVTHVIDRNVLIKDAIEDTLMTDMGNGSVIDAIPPIIDDNLWIQRMPYELSKAPASYLSDIFIELGNIMGADTYYDADGHMRYDLGTEDMSYSSVDSIWNFSDITPEYISPSLQFTTTSVVNSVTIVGNNSNSDEFWTYTAENHNPLSPVSIENIGLKSYYEESTSVYDDSTAKDYAEYVLNQKSILQQAMSFSCPLIPHLDVNKIITITDTYYKFNQERFIIQSITMPLDASSPMQITASNVSALPYYELREGSVES